MAVAAPHWEHFEHMADMGVRGCGPTPAAAFEQAALALTAVITDPAAVRPATAVPVEVGGRDLELLLADWLNALVFEMATRRMLFGEFRVSVDPRGLRAVARGEPVDPARHHPAVEVKGATLTALAVREGPPGWWTAQCVVDV